MEEIRVNSTSAWSADAGDIPLLLAESTITRLVFRADIISNPNNPAANVHGKFVWQRKGKNESWTDVDAKSLNTLHKGEGYEITLDSEAVFRLLNGLTSRSEIQRQDGIPWGEARYVPVQRAIESVLELDENAVASYLSANASIGAELVERLLAWVVTAANVEDSIRTLERLGSEAFSKLAIAVGVSTLEESLEYWKLNRENDSEESWQQALSARTFLFQQLYSWPCTIIDEKAYLGGKTLFNTGGNIADFLIANELTKSLAIVEIKTPCTNLVTASEIREGIHNISSDVSGAIAQILAYKDELAVSLSSRGFNPGNLDSFDPQCVVIVGNTNSLDTPSKRRSFQLYRRQLRDVEVVTYDELFRRVDRTIQLMMESPSTDTDDGELPW